MAEGDLERPSVPHVEIPTKGRASWIKGMACVAMLPLLGFIGQTGRTLWGEWESLRQAQVSERHSEIVGYVNITPKPSYAARPKNWIHDEEDATLLWSGWKDDKNGWFRIGLGEIDPKKISLPMGRDVLQAIDYPLFEKMGGARWDKVPDDAPVTGFEEKGVSVAYPIRVMDKVEIVNDHYGSHPVLVTLTPKVDTVAVFEATIEGQRVVMGHSGYFFGHHPVLYDRATESLWTEQGEAMVAVAGHRKGASLKLIARLQTVAWADWKSRHPDGKLLIGADRSQAKTVD